jgi:NADPH:quinone reductase-like Zn-dependent oxidoreductase
VHDVIHSQTVNLVRRPEAAKELLDLGADVVLSQDDPCLADKIRNATGPSLAVGAIDPVAGKLTKVRHVAVIDWAPGFRNGGRLCFSQRFCVMF